MSESIQNRNVNFQIEGIELLEYSINSPSIKLPENIQYRFDLSIEHKISIELKKVFVITSFKILNDDSASKYASPDKITSTSLHNRLIPTTVGITKIET